MKKLSVLMAIAFVDMLGVAIVFPLVPFYALRLKADPWMVGWIIASFSIAQLAASPLWGRFSDRYGRRPALLIGLAASGISFIVFAYAGHLWVLLLARAVQGAGGGTTGVVQAYVGDAVERKDRARALGWISASTNAGVMIGPAIGSFASRISYEAPGLIAAVICFANVLFAWRWLTESRTSAPAAGAAANAPSPSRRPVGQAVWEVIRHPRSDVSRLIWIYAVGMLGFNSMNGVLALFLNAQFGVTEASIGYFYFYIGALSIVMRAMVLGPTVERVGETGVMRVGSIALAAGLLLMTMPHTILLFALTIAIVPISTALLFPATSALLTHRAPKHELGQVMGVQQTFGGFARVIAPIWATAAFQGLGHTVPFYIASGVVAVVSLLAFRVKKDPEAMAEAA